jgi:small-conductance mechanosensitive channel
MDSRLLDVIIGLACFIVLIIMLAVLPMAMPANPGVAYLTAILIFILVLSGAGYVVNKQIV